MAIETNKGCRYRRENPCSGRIRVRQLDPRTRGSRHETRRRHPCPAQRRSRAHWLSYVIDREQYADGSLGEPYLIFPTSRTNSGDNEVKAGRIIEIPTQDDSPPFFTLKPSRSDQVSEVISVLVSPTPLEGLKIGENAQKLSVQQVAGWEKSWGGTVGRLEMQNGAGRTWTRQEKEAGPMPLDL